MAKEQDRTCDIDKLMLRGNNSTFQTPQRRETELPVGRLCIGPVPTGSAGKKHAAVFVCLGLLEVFLVIVLSTVRSYGHVSVSQLRGPRGRLFRPTAAGPTRADFDDASLLGESDKMAAIAPRRIPLNEVADVQIGAASDVLNDQHPATIYLLITDKLNVPLDATTSVAAPDFVDSALHPSGTLHITSDTTEDIAVELKAHGRVQSGKNLLLFKIALRWREAGVIRTAHLIRTHEISVGVFGESDILTVLGVPSLLLLPGFLVLVTAGILWRARVIRLKQDAGEFSFQPTKPDFWVLAISLSIGLAFVFRAAGHSYLGRYGLGDVIVVWVTSILIGALFYLTGASIRFRWVLNRTPSEGDEPPAVLRKAARLGLGVSMPRAELTDGAKDQRVYVLKRNGDSVWVTAGVRVIWQAGAPETFQNEIAAELKASGNAKTLAILLGRGKRKKYLIPVWDTAGPLVVQPMNVSLAKLTFGSLQDDTIAKQE